MQKKITLPTTKSKVIYGTLDSQAKSEKVIIFVHGFTGSSTESHYEKAVPFFTERNIDVFRFNLYGREKDARKSMTVTLQDHIDDTNAVVNYLADKYEEIYLVGHSLGAPVVAFIDNQAVSKITLWDPTNGFDSAEEKGMNYSQELDAYLCDYMLVSVFSKDLIEAWQALTIERQLAAIKYPVKIIFAGEHTKLAEWKDYLDREPLNKNYAVVEGASHTFSEPGKTEELYRITHKWIMDT